MDLKNTTNIKRVLVSFFVFIISIAGTAQEPPPEFKFSIEHIASDIDTFLNNYKILTFSLRDSIFTEKLDISKRKNNDLIRNIVGNSIYVFIYAETMLLPKEGDVIRFSLKKVSTNEKMNIFIRIGHNMDFGEEFELTNLKFQPGDFFLDKCKSKKKYQVSNTPTSEVNLLKLKKHKISIKKLNRILKKR